MIDVPYFFFNRELKLQKDMFIKLLLGVTIIVKINSGSF